MAPVVPLRCRECDERFSDPRRELVPTHCPRRNAEDDSFSVINPGRQLEAVQHQEDFNRRVADALVAVDERVIEDE